MRSLSRQWAQLERALKGDIAALTEELAAMRAAGKPITPGVLLKLEKYRSLLAQMRAETQKFDAAAAQQIANGRGAEAQQAVTDTQSQIEAATSGRVSASFGRLPSEAVEQMVAMLRRDAPLYQLLNRDYPETVARMTQTLLTATAQGINPRDTAKQLVEAMRGDLSRALTIARTEQIRAYREASLAQMRVSGVVDGWIWRCALQDTTCPACLAMDGTIHPLDEELNGHPNCRCFREPRVSGMTDPDVKSGREWFEQQSPETQETILGSARYAALSEGRITFDDLAQVRDSAKWGPTVVVAPLPPD
jgi:SPP1 gp7 family putative phage head morphogenesis protein